jgi:hypothetical protein
MAASANRILQSIPLADPDDPLQSYDDPQGDAQDGIISRDGGHFVALFAGGADQFAEEAKRLIQEKLPGLAFSIRIDDAQITKKHTHLYNELPVLAPCEWTGRCLASALIHQGNERPAVSQDVQRRHEAARRSEDGKAEDLASLLIARTKLKDLERPNDLDQLVGKGYLALIHADGNAVGSRANSKTDLDKAKFFHRNRVLLRRALLQAIDRTVDEFIKKQSSNKKVAPLLPLMLGGDDILVISRAEEALPFVAKLCEELDQIQANVDEADRLTLGIGVVIAKATVPIFRLHEIAEQLAGSAKRRFRSLAATNLPARSVVDWAIYTTAWADDPTEIRRRDWICGNGNQYRILSQRPLDVLGGGLSTLKGILEASEKLNRAPRSQLRFLIDQLPKGQELSELAFEELSPAAHDALKQAGVSAVWQTASGTCFTELLDLVEIFEINKLGRN